MKRYLKIKPEEYSTDYFGDHHGSRDISHFNRIKKAKTVYMDIDLVSQVAPYSFTEKVDDKEVEVQAAYLITHFEGAKNTNQSGNAQDRDTFVLVRGSASSWIKHIEAMARDGSVADCPEPETAPESEAG